jgi:hypothetical protein
LHLSLKVVAIWASFIPVAILNGTFRELCLAPFLGPRLALPLSGITAGLLFFLLTFFTISWLGRLNAREYWGVGLAWLLMTVPFEFLFGRLVAHKSWSELLQSYNLLSGNLWTLVLLAIACSPRLVAKFRHLAV